MGKTQSKRSVDITTENKKGSEEAEVTGKLEKIEDVDQKQVNGDATPQETNEAEKKDDESENDKDLTTEKSAENAQTNGEHGDQNTATSTTNTTTATVAESSKEDSKEATPKEGAADAAASAEEISPLADESMKKSKKEKVKKKWSFRSISFGKKDKQKPAKTEETNGDAEKATVEGVTEASKIEEGAAGDAKAKPAEQLENGDASEKELNGQKTPTPTEEKPAEVVANEETNATADAAATTTAVPTSSVPSASNETAMDQLTEKTAAIAISAETVEAAVTATAAVVSNGADAAKNGMVEATEDATTTGKAESETVSSVAAESNKTIPSVANDEGCDGEKTHQNGMAADELEAEQQSKSQIEVKTNTDNTTPAANLASSSTSTSSDPIVQNKNSDNAINSNEAISKVAMESATVEAEADFKNVEDDDVVTVTAVAEVVETARDSSVMTDTAPAEDDEKPVQPQTELVKPIMEKTVQAKAEIVEPDFEVLKVEVENRTNVKSADPSTLNDKQADATQPPPLPVSPPPSQVSVFAFKDNLDNDKMPSAEVLVASSTILPAPSTSPHQAEVIAEVATMAHITEQPVHVDLEPEMPKTSGLQAEIDEIAAQLESANINDEPPKTFITVMDIATTISQQGDAAIREENMVFVAAIVDEVTEKAVEIVQQQLEQQQAEKLAAEQQKMELPEEVEVEEEFRTQSPVTQPTQIQETEMEMKVDAPVSILVPVPVSVETTDLENVDVEKTLPPTEAVPTEAASTTTNTIVLSNGDDDKIEVIAHSGENVILSSVPPTVAQAESENQDCSLIVHLPSKEFSLNANDEFVSTIKEVASAKDLKENAAAEIKTQDLPVTCE